MACYTYPCNHDMHRLTVKCVVKFIKCHYDLGHKPTTSDDTKESIEKRLHLILHDIPDLLERPILDMPWDELKMYVEKFGEGFKGEVEMYKSMKKNDFEMITCLKNVDLVYSWYVEKSKKKRVGNMRTFLRRNPSSPNEVRILCIIGNSLSDEQAKMLREEPTDDDEMTSKNWKWKLSGCNGSKGLGKGYTANTVCANAQKGDIVAYSDGFIAPEWVVEQLRKRESKSKIPFTLVLLVDACYSGAWKKRIECELEKKKFQNTRLVVQTSCDENEESYSEYFIPLWCDLQKDSIEVADDRDDEIESKCMQTPTFFDSESKNGEGLGLKFFTCKEQCIRFKCKASKDNCRAVAKFFASNEGKIISYRLKHHKGRNTPMAFFLVQNKDSLYNLHVHFKSFKDFTLTGVSCVCATTDASARYKFEEIQDTKIRVHIDKLGLSRSEIEAFVKRCKDHVRDSKVDWEDEESWRMKKAVPPGVMHSNCALFEMRDPTSVLGNCFTL